MAAIWPDANLVADLRAKVTEPKRWVAVDEIGWVHAGGRPPGWKFRAPLLLPDGSQLATLFAEGYFKPSGVPGVRDKLSLSLFFRHHRILGLDENGPTEHRNKVGIGRQYFGMKVGHPQLHTVSDDSIYGYAEPIDTLELTAYWNLFHQLASIQDAPVFSLPPQQLRLRV